MLVRRQKRYGSAIRLVRYHGALKLNYWSATPL